MTKEEAIAALGRRMAANADAVVALCDAADAVLTSPLALCYVAHEVADRIYDFKPNHVECVLRQISGLRAGLEGG